MYALGKQRQGHNDQLTHPSLEANGRLSLEKSGKRHVEEWQPKLFSGLHLDMHTHTHTHTHVHICAHTHTPTLKREGNRYAVSEFEKWAVTEERVV